MLTISLPTVDRTQQLMDAVDNITGYNWSYPYEIIIVQSGKHDGNMKYLKNLNHKNIRIIYQDEITGVVDAYNIALKESKGEYFFIGSDDIFIYPKVFEKSCRIMDKHKEIGDISPFAVEPHRQNIFIASNHKTRFGTITGCFNIFRKNIFPDGLDINYHRNFIDSDTFLTCMVNGYKTGYTKDVGLIHFRKHRYKPYPKEFLKRLYKDKDYFLTKYNSLRNNVISFLSDEQRDKLMMYHDILMKILSTNFTHDPYFFMELYKQMSAFKIEDSFNGLTLVQEYPKEIIEGIDKC